MTDSIPVDGCILAMYVHDFMAPFPELRNRINKLYHLVGRFPFQTEIILFHLFKHCFPCAWMKTDIACGFFPCSVHKTILYSQFDTILFRQVCKFPEYFSKLGKGFLYRAVLKCPCKSAYVISSESSCCPDNLFQRLPVLRILDRIAVKSDRADALRSAFQQFFCLSGKLFQICPFQRHMKIQRKCLKSPSQKSRQPLFCPWSLDACSNLDLFHCSLSPFLIQIP